MKKKVFSVIALAIASVFACIGLIGCGSTSLTIGEEINESIGAGTKIEYKVGEETKTRYVNSKLYTFTVEEKGVYSVIIGGASKMTFEELWDSAKNIKGVAIGAIFKSADADGLSTSLINNAMKDAFTLTEDKKTTDNIDKMTEYGKKALKLGALGTYALDAGDYTFYVTSSTNENESLEYTIKVNKTV